MLGTYIMQTFQQLPMANDYLKTLSFVSMGRWLNSGLLMPLNYKPRHRLDMTITVGGKTKPRLSQLFVLAMSFYTCSTGIYIDYIKLFSTCCS